MALSWDQATPNTGLNPQIVYSGSAVGAGISTIMGGKLGLALIQLDLFGPTTTVWVQGRMSGMQNFFTMSLNNAAGGPPANTATGSGLFIVGAVTGLGSLEYRPVVVALSGSLSIGAAFTQG